MEENIYSICGEAETKRKRKIRVIVLIAVIAIALIVAAVLGIVLGRRAESEAYYTDMETAFATMLAGATQAENTGNLIISVWHNAIWEERDAETDPYTMENGDFVADFDIALGKLFADPDFKANQSVIQANRDDVWKRMQALQDPPEEYEKAYAALCDLYDQYWNLTRMAIDSSGSYSSYTEAFGDYDAAAAAAVDQFVRYYLKSGS